MLMILLSEIISTMTADCNIPDWTPITSQLSPTQLPHNTRVSFNLHIQNDHIIYMHPEATDYLIFNQCSN